MSCGESATVGLNDPLSLRVTEAGSLLRHLAVYGRPQRVLDDDAVRDA